MTIQQMTLSDWAAAHPDAYAVALRDECGDELVAAWRLFVDAVGSQVRAVHHVVDSVPPFRLQRDLIDDCGVRASFVVVHELSQRYGGPEEGGWWYDAGRVVVSRRIRADEDPAQVLAKYREEFPEGNQRWQTRPSVRDFQVSLTLTPGEPFPVHRPRYE